MRVWDATGLQWMGMQTFEAQRACEAQGRLRYGETRVESSLNWENAGAPTFRAICRHRFEELAESMLRRVFLFLRGFSFPVAFFILIQMPARLTTLLLLLSFSLIFFCLWIQALIRCSSAGYLLSPDQSPIVEVALVPGAAVYTSGKLSYLYEQRIRMILRLYRENRIQKILISGDHSTPYYNEIQPARRYLMDSGVDPAHIMTDPAGLDTYSSLYRAREVFQIERLLIVSQPFHLPRAVYIARSLGIEAFGVRASETPWSILNRYGFREVFAGVKAWFEVCTGAIPAQRLGS